MFYWPFDKLIDGAGRKRDHLACSAPPGCSELSKGTLLFRSLTTHGRPLASIAEAAAILRVCDTTALQEAVPVVQAELISLRLSADHGSTGRGPENHAAVVMPQCCGSLAAQLQMSKTAIETGGRRMLCALEYIHSKRLVHMEVKVQAALPHHVEMRMKLTSHFH